MCLEKYAAHPMCRHPYQNLPPGDDWTQHIVFEACDYAKLIARHDRVSPQNLEPPCENKGSFAVTDLGLDPFCYQCEHKGEGLPSATVLYSDFGVRLNQWRHQAKLSPQETQSIQESMEEHLVDYENEAGRGPHNGSYWRLRNNLAAYIAQWDGYVSEKIQAEQRREQQRRDDEMHRQIRQYNNIQDAIETSIYSPSQSLQIRASSSQSSSSGEQPGPSSQSHHRGHRHHQSGSIESFFGARKRRK